jgi:hypothetical protein
LETSTLRKARSVGLVATLLAATTLFAVVLDRHYPIAQWLFWRYAWCLLAALFWAGSCLSLGYAVLSFYLGSSVSWVDRLSLGFALGVLAFALSLFAIGLFHGLTAFTFYALPLAFLAVGAPRMLRDLGHELRRRGVGGAPPRSAGSLAIVLVGLLGIGICYFQILSPETFSFDARLYHIPIAQRYAMSGRVGRFDEGFLMGAYPQLASYLYAWAFLAPGAILFDRLELCVHIELVLFVATLAQIPVLLRRIAPGPRVGLTWVAMFLFPGIYLYDANLNGGADHVAAFWAIPIAIAFFRAWDDFRARNVLLFSLFLGAAALTKYTAVSIVVPPAIALFARGLWLCVRAPNAARWRAMGMLVVAPALVTAPHWLKNWIWYGDPMFPILRNHLAVRPWNPDAEKQIKLLEYMWHPAGATWDGLEETVRAMFTFSFVPNDWYVLHRDVPVFGSLFTLTIPCLPFLRRTRRIVWLYAGSMAAVFVWYWFSHFDRFLQVALPWMAAATAGCLVRIWEAGSLARVAVAPLVALQLVWGGDVPFFRTHNMISDSPIRRVSEFLASGFEQVQDRLEVYRPLETVGRTIPRRSVVLAHEVVRMLGIDRNWVTDVYQTRLSYARLRTPAAIHRELASLGVTHLVWRDSSLRFDSLASDLAFLGFATRHTIDRRVVGEFTVGRLASEPPAVVDADPDVALLGCGAPYRKGWYKLSELTLEPDDPGPGPAAEKPLDDAADAFGHADMIVIDTACGIQARPDATFTLASKRGTQLLYLRGPTSQASGP